MIAGITPLAMTVIAVGLAACAACVGSALYVARGWPIAMRRALDVLTDRVDVAETNLDSQRAKLAGGITELAAMIEEIEGLLGTIERKRRRIAGYEAREGKSGANGTDDPYLELKRRARAAGHPV